MDNLKTINTSTLAYMGDAVYEQAIRETLIKRGNQDVHKLHGMATRYVKASAQASAIKGMFEELSEEEQRLVKRARNKKPVTKAKNADPLDYRWATAFEAIVGYMYLAGNEERQNWIIQRAIQIIDGDK